MQYSVLLHTGVKIVDLLWNKNLGPTLAGVQESGWLFNKTLELSKKGVKITYSGDAPFLNRLVLGITNETTSPSRIPLHITDPEYIPTKCDPDTGLRSDVIIPFRKDLPKSSLVYFENVQSICPDVTHMTTRCVENDLQKIAQKIIREKYPNHDVAIRQLEENLTRRDAKRPHFQFNVSNKSGSFIGTIGPVSLAGSNAITVIADKEELVGAKEGDISDLYEGVWDPTDIILGSEDSADVPCVKVLRSWYPKLFNKDNPKQVGSSDKFISAFDACELLRSSLNQCVLCLRAEEFNCEAFKKCAETYYQTNVLIFGHAGLTPYKLKMMMFPQLVESGFIQRPYDHMCEGLEKSNHHANRDFQTKSMRGGGKIYHKDPLFLESSSSFSKFLRIATEIKSKETNPELAMEDDNCASVDDNSNYRNVTVNKKTYMTVSKSNPISVMSLLQSATKDMGIKVPGPEYLEICRKEITFPRIEIGSERNVLGGLRFCLLGRLGTWKKQTLTHDNVKQMIENMGGMVLDNDRADVLMNTHSQLPNCFVIVKDEKDLIMGTGSTEEINDLKSKPRRRGSSATRGSENEPSQYSNIAKRFAAGGFKFLKVDFLGEVHERKTLIDPEPYIIHPGSKLVENRVNDKRPLLLDQCSGKTSAENVSAIVALKRYRDGTFKL